MTVGTMDTHAVVKRLIAAGFTDEQAEAVTLVVREAQDIDLSNLATKADLSNLATKVELAAAKGDLEKTIADAKAEILKWMFGAIGVQTVAILGAVIALARLAAR